MAESDSASSPDPLVEPSSPFSTRPQAKRIGASTRPSVPRSSAMQSTPSKSFFMETGAAQEASPWRIKVTVQAEPKNSGTPTKKAGRATRKSVRSTSPVKGATPMEETDDEQEVVNSRRPQRKRKGIPIRRTTRSQRAQPEPTTEEDDMIVAPATESPPHIRISPTGAQSTRKRGTVGDRTKRLSHAREELGQALRDALGDSGNRTTGRRSSRFGIPPDEAGDLTVANEDFTMITGESLASIKANNSILSAINEGDRSYVSVSNMQSSPPRVKYPDVSVQAEEARTTETERHYDIMSWKPTMPANVISPERAVPMNESQTIGVAATGPPESQHTAADIWAEEASRSIEDDEAPQSIDPRSTARSSEAPPIFSDDPVPPRRSKIPRTWRKTSGVDFSYADSPGPEPAPIVYAKGGNTEGETDAESRRSSGVLTPPSTDDGEADRQKETETIVIEDDDEEEEEEEDDSELTQPDAAATQLQYQHQQEPVVSPGPRADVASPFSDSSSNVTSPDGEDTGMFWQSNMPHIYQRRPIRPRPKRGEAIDMSEILRMDSSKVSVTSSPGSSIRPSQKAASGSNVAPVGSPLKAASSSSAAKKRDQRFSPLRMRPVDGRIKTSPSTKSSSKLFSSPLRRSLLRSSKIPDSSASSSRTLQQTAIVQQATIVQQSEADDSMASKASDQRQLLGEMASARKAPQSAARGTGFRNSTTIEHETGESADYESEAMDDHNVGAESRVEHSRDEDFEEEYDEQEETEPFQSYEEHLNVESPQKIKVHFNDSFSHDSSLLAPKRQYAPLFDKDPNTRATRTSTVTVNTHEETNYTKSPPTITLIDRKGAAAPIAADAKDGIFSKLSTSFWSAVIRPSGPTSVLPSDQIPPASPVKPAELYFPASIRAQLRNRYGVLSNQHPWTMTHMRSLHRLLNSLTSHKNDSIVPTHIRLPPYLSRIVDTAQKTPTNIDFHFTTAHAHVVHAFLQILVPISLIQAMERGEVEWLGDAVAEGYRGLMGGRWGEEVCFRTYSSPQEGEIEWDWVMRCLGCAVLANDETEERLARERERKREVKVWREWDDE